MMPHHANDGAPPGASSESDEDQPVDGCIGVAFGEAGYSADTANAARLMRNPKVAVRCSETG